MRDLIKMLQTMIFICEFCQVTQNVATKYKVLKCSKSTKFNGTHNFIEYASFLKKVKK